MSLATDERPWRPGGRDPPDAQRPRWPPVVPHKVVILYALSGRHPGGELVDPPASFWTAAPAPAVSPSLAAGYQTGARQTAPT